MKTSLISALCALSLCSVALSQPQTQPVVVVAEDLPILQENSARIVLSTPKKQYVGGEYIKLDIALKNVGTKPIRFLPEDADWFYQIDVVTPGGQKAPLLGSAHTRRRSGGEPGGVTPNGSKTVRAWLSNIFDMTEEGTYKITVSQRFRLGNDVITVKSDPVTVEVTSTPTISEWQ